MAKRRNKTLKRKLHRSQTRTYRKIKSHKKTRKRKTLRKRRKKTLAKKRRRRSKRKRTRRRKRMRGAAFKPLPRRVTNLKPMEMRKRQKENRSKLRVRAKIREFLSTLGKDKYMEEFDNANLTEQVSLWKMNQEALQNKFKMEEEDAQKLHLWLLNLPQAKAFAANSVAAKSAVEASRAATAAAEKAGEFNKWVWDTPPPPPPF